MTAGPVPGADVAAAPERRARTLDDQPVKATLARLFAEKRAQRWRVVRHVVRTIAERIAGVRPSLAREVEQLTGFYASVTPQQGEFLYLVARSVRATRIVEYGTSVGVSATYLGAAVRDNGGGVVIGSELHPGKHATAIRNLAEAGLSDVVSVRLGNAVETLRDPGGIVDMMFLDGYPELYLAIVRGALPYLRSGTVIVADNIYTHARMLRPYRRFVRDAHNGFSSVTLPMKFGVEYSVRL